MDDAATAQYCHIVRERAQCSPCFCASLLSKWADGSTKVFASLLVAEVKSSICGLLVMGDFLL